MKITSKLQPLKSHASLIFARHFFQALLIASVLIALAILTAGGGFFNTVSNYMQIIAGFAGAVFCICTYRKWCRDRLFILCGCAFGCWAAANILWFLYVSVAGWQLFYPCIADAGFIAFFIFYTAAYHTTFPQTGLSRRVTALVLLPLLVIPLVIVVNAGITAATLTTLIICILSAGLILVSLSHNIHGVPRLFAGTVAYAAAMIIYSIRETLLPDCIPLYIAGPIVIASFCLIILGLIDIVVGCGPTGVDYSRD